MRSCSDLAAGQQSIATGGIRLENCEGARRVNSMSQMSSKFIQTLLTEHAYAWPICKMLACTCLYTLAHMHSCKHPYIHPAIHACKHTLMHTYIYTHMLTYSCVFRTYLHPPTYLPTDYIHIPMYMHSYIPPSLHPSMRTYMP